MKRAFAIIIVILLALGMVGLFFPAFMASAPVAAPSTSTSGTSPFTVQATVGTTTAP